jgi:hypothetical protein
MTHWFHHRDEIESFVTRLEPMRAVIESHLAARDEHEGYCCSCGKIVTFVNHRHADGSWFNLREGFLCECGLNGRMRESFWELSSLLHQTPDPRAVMFERFTPFFARMSNLFPSILGCEYIDPDLASGTIVEFKGMTVQHEDITQLSFADDSFDVVFHGDVLEHVPDYHAALRECHRILVRGGTLLFTCPFFALEEHIVRCVIKNGGVRHILPPAYHGNPVSPDGALVYTQHGWPLIEEISNAGFTDVQMGILYDPYQGILSTNNPAPEGMMWPILFKAIK